MPNRGRSVSSARAWIITGPTSGIGRRTALELAGTLAPEQLLPDLLHHYLSEDAAETLAPALSSMSIYLLMAAVLVVRPEGLFPAAGR